MNLGACWGGAGDRGGQLKASEGLPATVEGLDTGDDDALKRLHHVLLEVDVVTGSLVCTETGRKFPIAAGIPNMLLNQDEI
jgi:multifunctional methyltransferase subunit TRM112